MQGCGNDFVVIESLSREVKIRASQVKRLADRRFGIGFDQLLLIEPPLRATSDFALAIYNSDGSPAAHCGNGFRCAARFTLDNKLTLKEQLIWDLTTGNKSDAPIATRKLASGLFQVCMGVPSFEPSQVPFSPDGGLTKVGDHTWKLELDHEAIEFVPVGLGNPHAVVMVRDISHTEVERIGAGLGQYSAFPEGVNVGFCQRQDNNSLALRVFERGVGETLACGSGACAAASVSHLLGETGEEVRVELPGGTLRVGWKGEGAEILLSGPAETSFCGRVEL